MTQGSDGRACGRARRITVTAAVVAMTAGACALPAVAWAEVALPSLSGESFNAYSYSPDAGGVTVGPACGAGTVTLSYDLTGAAYGPYAGTFHESGTATFELVTPSVSQYDSSSPSFENHYRSVSGSGLSEIASTFAIDSPTGQVLGQRSAPSMTASCFANDSSYSENYSWYYGYDQSYAGGSLNGSSTWTATITKNGVVRRASGDASLSVYGYEGEYTQDSSGQHYEGDFAYEYLNSYFTETTPINVAPVANAGGPYVVDEGGSVQLVGTGTDTDGGTLTYSWDLDGDGTSDASTATATFDAAGLDGPSNHAATLTVCDASGACDSDTATVSVRNVAPVVTFTGSTAVNEGSAFTGSGTVTDPGPDTLSGTVSYVDGTVEVLDIQADGSFTLSHTYLDDNPTGTPSDAYTVTVTVNDGDGGTDSASQTTTVSNLAPVAGDIAYTSSPVALGSSTSVTMPFTDAGTEDTHIAVINWDDNTSSPGTISNGIVSGSHTYAAAGVYTISVTLTDDDSGTDSSTTSGFVVVYDTNGGSVSGGGHIMSPAGALVADPTATGKATFGFVSQYKRGATVPTGNTQFQFQAAGLNFSSTSYDWLVVAGTQAQYKGRGTIGGTGDYGFLLTAVDGSPDRFRIKISNRATGGTVYDNQIGTTEDSSVSTALGGGSIVIHK